MDGEHVRRMEDSALRPEGSADEDLEREIEAALGDGGLEGLIDAEDAAAAADEGVRTGRVIAVHGEDVFVDLGGKNQGVVPAEQFDEEPLPAEGDRIEVTVEGYDERDGLLLLSRKGAVRAAAWDTVETGDVVEGRVTGHNKGGLELVVSGIRAFMPVSQIEQGRVEDLAPYVNRRLRCEVIEIDRQEGTLVVSRRNVLDREAAMQRERTLETLAEGQTVAGVVRRIMPYGAFVDIGGVDGLLHVSDMSYSRVEDPAKLLQVGQELTVQVLAIDAEKDRISLGLKQILADPWEGAVTKWPVGEIVTGRVTHLADFGAFVELAEGVDGLIPISEMSFQRRIRHPGQVVNEGDTVKVRVLNVDVERRRISLSIKQAGADPWTGASVRWPEGSIIEGNVKRITDYGAFVELAPGVEGLVHISELGEGFVRSVGALVEEGQLVRAKVLSVDEDERRISLSIKQAAGSPGGPAEAIEPDARRPRPKRKRPLKGGLD
jgi:small subunit ribosomal protein S1